MSSISKVYLQSVVPKNLGLKVHPEIATYFKTNFNSDVKITQLQLSKIPNSILSVGGNPANVVATYAKLYEYFGGKFIDPGVEPLKKYYIRGLDKVFKPMFLIPHDFKLNFARLNWENDFKKFRSHYKQLGFLPFENSSYDIWRVSQADVPTFMNYLLLNTITSRPFFALEKDDGVITLKDEELVTEDVLISKKDLTDLQSQGVKYAHLLHNYLCEVALDYDLFDEESDELTELKLVKVTGPPEMVPKVVRMFQFFKEELNQSRSA